MSYFACGTNKGSSKKLLTIPLEEGESVRTTEKAFGLKINGQMVWLPSSQLTDVENSKSEFSCWCPLWLIEKNGLEIFIDTSYEPSLF